MNKESKGLNIQTISIGIVVILIILIGVLGYVYSSRLAKLEATLADVREQIDHNAIGVLDIQRVIEESPRALDFQERLDKIGEEIDLEFLEKSKDLDEMSKQVFQQQAYSVYIQAKQQLEAELDNEIERALQAVLGEENMGIILYKQGLRLGGTDITDSVIGKLQ